MKKNHPADVVQNILPKRSSTVRAIYGTVSKADSADTACKAERLMASIGDVRSEEAFAPPSWEQRFPPNQEAVGRGAASD